MGLHIGKAFFRWVTRKTLLFLPRKPFPCWCWVSAFPDVMKFSCPSCHALTHSRAVWNAEVEVVSCLSSMIIFDNFFFLRQGLSWTQSPWNRLGWLPANWRNHFVSAWLLHLSAGESTSGSHACAVSTFLNESPPQSLSQILGIPCISESNPQESSPVKETTENTGATGECCSISFGR